jgi:hypothetical protein
MVIIINELEIEIMELKELKQSLESPFTLKVGVIYLAKHAICNDGAKLIAENISKSALKVMYLMDNNIGPTGASYLIDSLEN